MIFQKIICAHHISEDGDTYQLRLALSSAIAKFDIYDMVPEGVSPPVYQMQEATSVDPTKFSWFLSTYSDSAMW